MYTQLTNNIKKYVNFTNEELVIFLSYFKREKFKRSQKILKEGETCRKLFYINSGLIRYYYSRPPKELTFAIMNENFWFTDYEAFMSGTPANIFVEAMENSELFYITYESLQELYDKGLNFQRYGRLVAEERFLILLLRDSAMKTKTPEERYLLMYNEYPELMKKTQLKYIASMLNIEPSTLSRIRKKLLSS